MFYEFMTTRGWKAKVLSIRYTFFFSSSFPSWQVYQIPSIRVMVFPMHVHKEKLSLWSWSFLLRKKNNKSSAEWTIALYMGSCGGNISTLPAWYSTHSYCLGDFCMHRYMSGVVWYTTGQAVTTPDQVLLEWQVNVKQGYYSWPGWHFS